MKIHISFLFRSTCTLIFLIIFSFLIVDFTGKNLKNNYLAIGETQVDKVTSIVALKSVENLMNENYAQVDFITDNKDTVFNTGSLNHILSDAVNLVCKELKSVENGSSSLFESKYGKGVIYEIPFNIFLDNVLLSSIGPRIPVKYYLVGDIKGRIETEVESFGINNAVINLNLLLNISSKVALPLVSDLYMNEVRMLLYSKIFTGDVPYITTGEIEGVNEVYSTEVAI